MKYLKILPILLVLFLSNIVTSCTQNNSTDSDLLPTDLVDNPISAKDTALSTDANEKLAKFKFMEHSYDFGVLVEGEKVAHNFKFKNVGKTDLIITNASSTCGCTISNYPKEPVKPGEEAAVEVVFDSSGKMGVQHKRVTLLANTIPNRTYLDITAEVVAPNQIKN